MNEVKIIVRTENAAKAGFEAADKDVNTYAEKFAKSFSEKFTKNLAANMTQHLTQQLQQVSQQAEQAARGTGERIGDTIGRTASERITTRISERLRDSRFGRMFGGGGGNGGDGGDGSNAARSGGLTDRDRVHVDVDVDKQGFLSRMANLGKEGAAKFASAFQTGFGAVFNGDVISTVLKTAAVVGLSGFLAPALAAAISSSVLLALGGGAIGAGIAIGMKDPRIQAAVKGIKGMLAEIATDFGANFKPIIEDFIAPGNKGGGGLVGVLEQVRPLISDLGRSLAPLAGELGKGLIGFLQNVLPGVIRGMKGAEPVIQMLADKLPGLGDDIAKFFDHITAGAPDAAVFFGDLLEGIGFAIRAIGKLIEIFTRMYTTARTLFLALLATVLSVFEAIATAASISMGWIPGLGPKVNAAAHKFAEFRKNVVKELNRIPSSKTFTMHINVVGLAAARTAVALGRILAGMAHGGVAGHAAEGGARAGMTWVGEHGPELVQLPPGSQVHSTGDSARMAGAGGGGGRQELLVRPAPGAERGVLAELVKALRFEIGTFYGGDSQAYWGAGA